MPLRATSEHGTIQAGHPCPFQALHLPHSPVPPVLPRPDRPSPPSQERVQQRLEVWKRSRDDAHVTPLEALQLEGDSSDSLCGLEADCHLASKAGASHVPKDCQLGGNSGGSGLTGIASTPSDVCSPGSSSSSGVEKKLTVAGTGSSLSIEADCHSGQREGGGTGSSACDSKRSGGEGQADTSNPLFDTAALGIEGRGEAVPPLSGAQAKSGNAERK